MLPLTFPSKDRFRGDRLALPSHVGRDEFVPVCGGAAHLPGRGALRVAASDGIAGDELSGGGVVEACMARNVEADIAAAAFLLTGKLLRHAWQHLLRGLS